MFTELSGVITSYNDTYQKHNLYVWGAEHTEDAKQIELAIHKRDQFIHDYVAKLEHLVLDNDNFVKLTAKDVRVFDLVPYTVWFKLSERTRRILKLVADNEYAHVAELMRYRKD